MMEDLLNILHRIGETQTAIRRVESVLLTNPTETALGINLESLQKRQRALEEKFSELANRDYLDLCTYRIITNGTRPSIHAVTQTLTDFQSLFTTIFDAIKSGPKERAKISPDITLASSFEYGYSFISSVGFVLTMPNERLLVGSTDLDVAMNTIFEIAKAKERSEIASHAKKVGVAAIRQIYKWAGDHIRAAFDADIQWKRDTQVRASLLIQVPEMEHLQQTISQVSEEIETTLVLKGRLLGADIKTKRFRFQLEDETEITGTMSDTITDEHVVSLPQSYTATIIQTTKVLYSREANDVFHYLKSLD